jgi:mechanosensitive ion channel-like protein
MVQQMTQELTAMLVEPFHGFWTQVSVKLPGILAALVLLLIGMVVARVIRTAIQSGLKYAKLDQYTDKINLNELLSRLGMGRSPSFVVGFMVYWLIILVFLVSAANTVKLVVVAQVVERFLLFIPHVLAAVLVVAAGLLIGRFLGEIVQNAATANRIQGSIILSKIVNLVVVVFSAVMALEQLGVDTSIMTSSAQIILATLGLALAIAFGLGGRDVAADIIRDFTAKRS